MQMALDLGPSGLSKNMFRRGKCSVWFVQYLANVFDLQARATSEIAVADLNDSENR